MRILVTDGETRAALAVTRGLGALGHVVHVSATRRRSLAGSSRYCAAEHGQSALAAGPDALARSLLRTLRDVEPDAIVGVTDPTLAVFHRSHDELSGVRVVPPTGALYEAASNKVSLFERAQRLGIPVPPGIVVAPGDLPTEDDLVTLGSSLVVRPALSWRIDGERFVQGSVSYEAGRESLARRVASDPALSFPYLVQRRIDGEGCGLFLLAQGGEILEFFAHRRIREKPPSGGVSTLCESVIPAPDLRDAAVRFARDLAWSGLAMLEFKRDAAGGAFLLEVNARPWGSMALAAAAGLDFPGRLLSLLAPGPRRAPCAYRPGVRLRWFWGDVDHFYLQERAAGHAGYGALLRGLVHALRAGPWPDAWDTFRGADPLPFASETWSWIRA